jgi:hypothetical protein
VKRVSNPEPDDLDPKLTNDPLHKKGFSDELQRKIEQAVDKDSRVRHRMRPTLLIAATAVTAAAFIFFPWGLLQHQSKASIAETALIADDTGATISSPPPISSALLIGFRTDHEEKDPSRVLSTIQYSSYRTMLIAPQRGELQKTAEGNGILMPYKRDFWKIDSLTYKTNQDEYHYLSAHLAEQPVKTESFADDPNEEIHHVETLVFAGNQYLSVAESEEAWAGNAPSRNDRIWVRTLPQLTAGRNLDFGTNKVDNRHVSLSDVFGSGLTGILDKLVSYKKSETKVTEITGESWTISRAAGQWVPRVAETIVPKVSFQDRYTLHDFPKALPQKVVSHDTLCCSWPNIQSNWPHATDALSSPMNDIVAIFEEGKLKFFPYGQASGGKPLLTIDLIPGEQLVMAQWATDHYVQEWIDKVNKYLAP